MESSTNEIRKESVILAPRSRVWRAIADSTEFGAWFGVKFEGPFVPGQAAIGAIEYQGRTMPFEVVVDRIDAPALGPEQVAAELEIIGRVREDHVDRLVGQALHRLHAIAHDDLVERQQGELRPALGARRLPRLNSFKNAHRPPPSMVNRLWMSHPDSAVKPKQNQRFAWSNG